MQGDTYDPRRKNGLYRNLVYTRHMLLAENLKNKNQDETVSERLEPKDYRAVKAGTYLHWDPHSFQRHIHPEVCERKQLWGEEI